jgi:hypothetical protein
MQEFDKLDSLLMKLKKKERLTGIILLSKNNGYKVKHNQQKEL